MRQFAQGVIYAVPAGANPTPIPCAVIKSATVEVKRNKKPLRGQWAGIIDVADADLDISIKIATADFRADVTSMVAGAGAVTTTGSVLGVEGEAATVPGGGGTVTVSQSATFVEDGGVLDLTAGKWLTRGATASGAGIYSVAAGVYTLNVADAGHNLMIVYSYSSATVGKTVTISNTVMGPSTGYKTRVYNRYNVNGTIRPLGWDFPNVHYGSLSEAFKSDDWAESNLDGIVAQDTTSLVLAKKYVGE